MGSSNNPTNEDELLLSRVYKNLDVPTVQEFVNIDKDLQTVQDISDVNIIILIYLFINHVLFILMYLYKCKMQVIWSHNFRFSISLSLSPNLLYRQTNYCT
jgi:hypothetical protein